MRPRTWDPLLQYLHLDKHSWSNKNTKKQGMRNTHAHAVRVNYGQDKKGLETQLPLLKSWERKPGSGAKAGYSTCRLHSTAPRGGQTTQATPLAQPLDRALSSPHIRNHLALLAQGASKGNLFIFISPCCGRSPSKALA